ncbi:MAG: ABC transporter ATP-binding protein [Clostridia bacterium]|nr:ABC transporter ATP-binding protein [Clostridia bacterium]
MYISVKNLNKTFKIQTKKKGLLNAIKAFIKPKYREVKAVDDISFSINKGEIVGLIGPNGAGKSTTIKMLCGILYPDSGECMVAGLNPFEDRKKYTSKLGVVFGQKSQLWWDIPVIESFELLKNIYKIPEDEYKKTKNDLVEKLDIKKILDVPVRQLSLGQRMRCEIVASLLHNPEILFLDEPTIGLDAISKVQLRQFIKEINKDRKITIILTTHDMTDIEQLAKRVMVIGKGKLLYDGSLKAIKTKFQSSKKLEIIYNSLKEIPNVKSKIIEQDSKRILFEVENNSKETISNIIEKFSKVCQIEDINIYENNIDNIILELYKEYEI